MEEDVETLSNANKPETGDGKSVPNCEPLQILDESDGRDVENAPEAVDQIVSSVNKSIDGEGGKVDILDDQTSEEASAVDVVSCEMTVAKSGNSHVETEVKEELGRGGGDEKVEFGTETTDTETLDVLKTHQVEELNSIEEVDGVKDMVDVQQFAELPMEASGDVIEALGDRDEVEVGGVNEIEGGEGGETELVDEVAEAKGDEFVGQSSELGIGENPADVEEEHVEMLSKEDITMIDVRTEVMMVTEQTADVDGVGKHENASEFNVGLELVDADAVCKLGDMREVEDENVGVEVLNGSKLENTSDEHDAIRCEHMEHNEMGDEESSLSSKKMLEGEKLNEIMLKDVEIEKPEDEHADISFEHKEVNNIKSLKTASILVQDGNMDGENSNDPKSDEPVNEHIHSIYQHAENKDMADINSEISGTDMLKDENIGVDIAKDSEIEEPQDEEDPENKNVKDVECSESAMVVDESTSMEARNDSRLEEPMAKHCEDEGMDDADGLKHVIKENDHMAIENLKESTSAEPIDVSESRNVTLIAEEHPAGNIRTGTDAREEVELTKKDVTTMEESTDVALVTEEHSAGDVGMDIGTSEEAELTRKDIMGGTLSGNDVVFDMGTSTLADEPQVEEAGNDSEETRSDVDEPVPKMNDSSGAPQDGEDINMVAEEDTGTQDTEMETETDAVESAKAPGVKRKRENLSKSHNSKATTRAASRKMVGEDVCFICFDGGELVLCDRRGCPKAYHPSCVNRDEAFFKSKGRWNCGWHICSKCEKNARYMCYTCTFSLCKSCIKDAVFFCVRETKGFCETCMKTVRLIENSEQDCKDATVDFDDKSSWDYLFKDYYIELKEKLSLSSAEIAGAKNPWRVVDMLSGPSKEESSEARTDANDGESGTDNSIENLESNRPKKRKIRKKAKTALKTNDPASTGVVPRRKSVSSSENLDWASKELLEFVSYMKNGDTSMISQYDVQALLLEYIKRKNLRDPRRKSQIICDVRLLNLFGKPRVGHFEMLKLLESHFLMRGEQNDDIQASSVGTESHLDIDDNTEPPAKGAKDKKRKTRKKGRGNRSNLDDYAAIDTHNISLIYLRRKLLEDLLDDAENFHDKVVGKFVRIRIPGSNQKQDIYRLVQVVGTSKAQNPYKMSKKTTDVMLDILNLNKNETVSIDTLSNQEFTEEECKRLRQSIKYGFLNRLTVGEILEKSTEIQSARVNDWLEAETLRLSHLRDRASDMGRRKELRECVEKLQLLKSPEERQRRMDETPEIHSDPKMDPAHVSDESDSEPEDTKRDVFTQSRGSSFNPRARGQVSPVSDKDSWTGSNQALSRELSRNMSGNNFSINSSDTARENSWNPERDRHMRESNVLENVTSNIKTEPSVSRYETLSSAASLTLPSPSFSPVVKTESSSVKINESEKMWHYKDPTGKVQGPFSIVQLRKWNNTGYFPADLKIWKTDDIPEHSVFLSDALAGKFPNESPAINNASPSASNNLRGSHTLAGHHSLLEDKERSIIEQISGSTSQLSSEKWVKTESMNLPSPTPLQQSPYTIQSPAVNNAAMVQSLPSPTPVSPNLMVAKSNLTSPVQGVGNVVSPTPNPQQNMLMGPSADPLQSQATNMVSGLSNGVEQQIYQQPSTVQAPTGQNPLVDPQNWSGGQQSTQPQVYWGPPNVQNPSGNFSSSAQTIVPQPNLWGPTQGVQQANMQPYAATPDTSAAVNQQMQQANPNVMLGNSTQPTTNMNWTSQMQPQMQAGNPIHGMGGYNAPNMNPGWPSWGGGAPGQGQMPGWTPPTGTTVPLQGQPPQVGNTGQGWGGGPRPSNQDPGGGQYGRNTGYGGGRSWNNRQQPYGGGSRKRDTVCPYNTGGRCRKGSRCDYLHI